jgi:hypothetical protein
MDTKAIRRQKIKFRVRKKISGTTQAAEAVGVPEQQ